MKHAGKGMVIDMKTRKPFEDDFLQKSNLVTEVRALVHFNSSEDSFAPAQLIDRYLREALPKHGKTRDHVREALEKAERNVTHWERLRIDYEARSFKAALEKRRHPLSKKVQKYVWLLEALADVLAQPRDEVIFAAFKNSLRDSNSESQPAEQLASWINAVAEAVVKSEEMRQYFQEAETVRGFYDEITGSIEATTRLLMEGAGASGVFLGSTELAWIQYPLPRVPLFRSRRHNFDGPLYVSKKPIAVAKSSIGQVAKLISPTRPEHWDVAERPLEGFRKIQAHINIYAELRLVIGPSKSKQDVEAMFETGAWLSIELANRERLLTFPFSIVPMAGFSFDGEPTPLLRSSYRPMVAIQLDDGWHSLVGVGNRQGWQGLHEASEAFGVDLDAGPQIEALGHNCQEFLTYWWPVDASTLKKAIQSFVEGSFNSQNLVPTTGSRDNPTEVPLGFWPDLEIALFNGSIDSALAASCKRLKEQLRRRQLEAKQVRERERDQFVEHLRKLSEKTSQNISFEE